MWTRTLTRKAYFCGSPPKILSLHVSPKYQAQVSSSRIKSPLPNFQPHSHYIRNTLLRPSWNKMIIIIIINRLKKIQETNNERIVRLFICDVTNARLTPQLKAPLYEKIHLPMLRSMVQSPCTRNLLILDFLYLPVRLFYCLVDARYWRILASGTRISIINARASVVSQQRGRKLSRRRRSCQR